MWSGHYKRHARRPQELQLAPWVAERYSRRMRRNIAKRALGAAAASAAAAATSPPAAAAAAGVAPQAAVAAGTAAAGGSELPGRMGARGEVESGACSAETAMAAGGVAARDKGSGLFDGSATDVEMEDGTEASVEETELE